MTPPVWAARLCGRWTTCCVYSYNMSVTNYTTTIYPPETYAVGSSIVSHPPVLQCDGLDCSPGSQAVIAEAVPLPYRVLLPNRRGHVISCPKNFSTPQRH